VPGPEERKKGRRAVARENEGVYIRRTRTETGRKNPKAVKKKDKHGLKGTIVA